MEYVHRVYPRLGGDGPNTLTFQRSDLDIMRVIHEEVHALYAQQLEVQYLVLNEQGYEALTWQLNHNGSRIIPNEFGLYDIILDVDQIPLVKARLSARDEYINRGLLERIRGR